MPPAYLSNVFNREQRSVGGYRLLAGRIMEAPTEPALPSELFYTVEFSEQDGSLVVLTDVAPESSMRRPDSDGIEAQPFRVDQLVIVIAYAVGGQQQYSIAAMRGEYDASVPCNQ